MIRKITEKAHIILQHFKESSNHRKIFCHNRIHCTEYKSDCKHCRHSPCNSSSELHPVIRFFWRLFLHSSIIFDQTICLIHALMYNHRYFCFFLKFFLKILFIIIKTHH